MSFVERVDLAVTYQHVAVVFIVAGIQPWRHVAFLSQREVHTYGNILAQKLEVQYRIE